MVAIYHEDGSNSGFSIQAQERNEFNVIIEYQQLSAHETIDSLARIFSGMKLSLGFNPEGFVNIGETEFRYI
jgi:hypothetical protein